MQAIIKISLVSVLAAFIACNGSEKSGSLNDKKNKLAALKKEVCLKFRRLITEFKFDSAGFLL